MGPKLISIIEFGLICFKVISFCGYLHVVNIFHFPSSGAISEVSFEALAFITLNQLDALMTQTGVFVSVHTYIAELSA